MHVLSVLFFISKVSIFVYTKNKICPPKNLQANQLSMLILQWIDAVFWTNGKTDVKAFSQIHTKETNTKKSFDQMLHIWNCEQASRPWTTPTLNFLQRKLSYKICTFDKRQRTSLEIKGFFLHLWILLFLSFFPMSPAQYWGSCMNAFWEVIFKISFC